MDKPKVRRCICSHKERAHKIQPFTGVMVIPDWMRDLWASEGRDPNTGKFIKPLRV